MTARERINKRLHRLKAALHIWLLLGLGLMILRALVNSPDINDAITLTLILATMLMALVWERLAPRCPFCQSRLPHFASRDDYFKLPADFRCCPACRTDLEDKRL
jgi:hypothetical protein